MNKYSMIMEKAGTAAALIKKITKETALSPVGGKLLHTSRLLIEEASTYIDRRNDVNRNIADLLKKSSNRLRSLQTAAAENDVSLEEFSSSRKQALSDLETALNCVENTLDSPPKVKRVREDYEALAADDDHLEEEMVKLQRHQEKLAKIPSAREKKFVVARLPIVAIFDPFVTTEMLNAAGFNVTAMGGYPILQEQLILCVSHAYNPPESKNSKLDLKKGSRVIVRESEGSNVDYWFATVKKVTSTKVTVDTDSGDEDVVYDRKDVVALLDDDKISNRQKDGVTRPLHKSEIDEYTLTGETTEHNPNKVADRLVEEITSRPEGHNLMLMGTSSSRLLDGYLLYWLVDSKALSRLQSKRSFSITSWSLAAGSWKDMIPKSQQIEYDNHQKEVEHQNKELEAYRRWEAQERRMQKVKDARRGR